MQEVATQKKQKCHNILGWIKQIFYIYCWIIIIVFAKCGEYEAVNYNSWSGEPYVVTRMNFALFGVFLASLMIMIIIYSYSFIGLCLGKNRAIKLLDNINQSTSINEIIDTLLKEKPLVSVNCLCYHTETRSNTYVDQNGNVRTQYSTVMVPTYTESQHLNIFSYLDISGIFRLKETSKKYIQLQLGKEINFNDEITIYDIQTIINDLYQKNRFRDLYISIGVDRVLPSFKDFHLIKLTNENNCFLQKWIYYLFFVLTFEKFYELYLDCICSKQFFVIKKIVSSRENVLENPKYSQFISGYNINEENITYQKDILGGIDKEIEVKLPTEREIALSKDYNKYIPQYMMKEDGEIINMNQNSVEKIMEIKEENQKGNIENKNNEKLNDIIEINSDNNINEMNQPLISNSNNSVELKDNKI